MDTNLSPMKQWEEISENKLSEIERIGPGCPDKVFSTDVLLSRFLALFQTNSSEQLDRDRVLVVYTELINLMKQRLAVFKSLVCEGGELAELDPRFIFQTRIYDPSWGIDCLYVYNEFCFTILGHFRYLQKYLDSLLKYDFNKVISDLDAHNSNCRSNIEALHKTWSETKKIDENLKKTCCNQVWKEYQVEVTELEKLTNQIESDVYDIKLGNDGNVFTLSKRTRMTSMITSAIVLLSSVAFAATPTITDVMAHQRNPWNGIVDISYTVTGDIAAAANEDGLSIALKVSATDRATGSNYVANTSALSGDMGLKEGTHQLVWDLGAEGLAFKSSNVVFGVSCETVQSLYCVIDLLGGTDATAYPITYLAEPPSGGFNTDEYKTTKLVLRRIDPGSYMMGCSESEVGYRGNEAVPHTVTICKPFYIGVFEVTQRQFELVTGNKPSYYNNSSCYAMRPVEQVSWNDIRGNSVTYNWPMSSSVDSASFMGKLRSKTGIATFDLPTEAKWEYACRAGTVTALNSGKNLVSTSSDVNMDEVGRYYYTGGYLFESGSYKKPAQSCTTVNGTAAVGSYLPNSWGLYDMHGNVYEWCLDRYQERDSFSSAAEADPVGPDSGSTYVRRGGSCYDVAQYCRSAYRSGINPSEGHPNIGFRVASTFEGYFCCKAETLPVEIDLYTNMGLLESTLRTEDNSATNLVTACTNDCRVTFKWKCSCEPMFKGNPYDYLSFSIDGVQQAFICGETDWTNQSYTVSGAGEHTYTWTYQKDAQDAAGEDCGWV